MKVNLKAFSIIEVLVGIFIFTLGISSIYSLLVFSLNTNDYNKNLIIASNLSRESLELVRNLRDSNYNNFYPWNFYYTWTIYEQSFNLEDNYFSTWFYIIENFYNNYNIKMQKISNIEDKEKYRLCLDTSNRYVYCDWSSLIKTNFFSYIEISYYMSWSLKVEDTYKISSNVIFNSKWKHEFKIDTILTDFKRL